MIYKCALGSTCATPTLVVNLTGIPLPPPDGGTPEGGMPEGGSEAGPAEAGVDGGMFVGFQPPELIAVDSKYIYWTDQSGDINSQLLAGGPPVTIVDNLDNPNFPPLPTAILANNGILYWVAGQFGGNGINACPANASCTANPGIYNMDFSAVAMATDGTDLYWTDSSPAAVKKCTLGLTCASPTTIVTQPTPASPGDITVDAKHTYWLDSASGGVYEFSK